MNAHAAAPIILNAMLRRCILRSDKFGGDVAGRRRPLILRALMSGA